MSRPVQELQRFFRELKRRNVYKVAIGYLVAAFVALQAADLLVPETTLPAGTETVIVYLTIAGFPLALVIAWAFEVTPEGVRRTPEAEPAEEGRAETGGGLSAGYKMLVALGLVGAAVAGGWYLTGGGGDGRPATRAGDRSIAVLPFENMGDEESEQFTEGIHDGLLTRLSNVGDLKVISRTSVMQFRETDLPLPAIADSLGVKWVMEGGVQKMSDQIQVNAQLIDPRTDTHAWAKSYRRDLTATDLFAIQTEITKRIARSLEAQLSPRETERVERQPTRDLDAYRLYVQGRIHLDQRSERGIRRGIELFERALAKDSTYALAWAGLADAQQLYSDYYGSDTLGASLPSPETAARRALRIDSTLAEAHASLGHLLFHRQEGPAAVRELKRALELKPSYARAHHWLGILLARLGRLEAARPRLERAVELDPMSPPIHVALASWYRYADRPEEALKEARRASELAPGYRSAFIWRAGALLDMGRPEEAAALLRRLLERNEPTSTPPTVVRAALAVGFARTGQTERARTLLDQVKKEGGEPYWVAMINSELGEIDAAFKAIERAGLKSLPAAPLRYEPILDPLRGDPRYGELIEELNRQWGLNPDGSPPDSVDVSFRMEAEE